MCQVSQRRDTLGLIDCQTIEQICPVGLNVAVVVAGGGANREEVPEATCSPRQERRWECAKATAHCRQARVKGKYKNTYHRDVTNGCDDHTVVERRLKETLLVSGEDAQTCRKLIRMIIP